MNAMPVIVMPKPLVEKLGDEGSRALVDVINESVRAAKLDWAELSAERFERRLVESTGTLRQEIAGVRAELKADIANVRAELIRWMFVFWVGQVAAVAGILALFLK